MRIGLFLVPMFMLSANAYAANCTSYNFSVPKYETICFSQSKYQYRCVASEGRPAFSYVQKITLKSSLNDASICDYLDDEHAEPQGLPAGAKVLEK
ncbi:hypothetical protein EOI86_06640 [Hwanghaeella grinnelliae]|uniref:DUF3551 domain-containing protein n=1 Tax=Hwanghaeella grinnelliae TaxID=2500179 RepID=A0A3S2WBZ1_9PROT|nr:hypothetical protein [Hwanghaeella grinnelliae]RVU38937.1 hypothetical protein EOI86_06640 [Hwanghaeella grinnelliae]